MEARATPSESKDVASGARNIIIMEPVARGSRREIGTMGAQRVHALDRQ
jgi:hypothetical protein